jgi:hypothetical protein
VINYNIVIPFEILLTAAFITNDLYRGEKRDSTSRNLFTTILSFD